MKPLPVVLHGLPATALVKDKFSKAWGKVQLSPMRTFQL